MGGQYSEITSDMTELWDGVNCQVQKLRAGIAGRVAGYTIQFPIDFKFDLIQAKQEVEYLFTH